MSAYEPRFGRISGVLPGGYSLDDLIEHNHRCIEVELATALKKLRGDVARLAEEERACAKALQGEIDRGVAIRQSLESKAARVDVMTVFAERLERLLAPPAEAKP